MVAHNAGDVTLTVTAWGPFAPASQESCEGEIDRAAAAASGVTFMSSRVCLVGAIPPKKMVRLEGEPERRASNVRLAAATMAAFRQSRPGAGAALV